VPALARGHHRRRGGLLDAGGVRGGEDPDLGIAAIAALTSSGNGDAVTRTTVS